MGLCYDGDARASYLLLEDLKPSIRRVEYDVLWELKLFSESVLPYSDWVARILCTPSLTLWEYESRKGSISAADLEEGMGRAAKQLNAFQHAGGEVLFGTDVGYTNVFDTSEEFKWMSQGA